MIVILIRNVLPICTSSSKFKAVVAIWLPRRYEWGTRLADASEGGRICFMRVIDALLQEKRAKQA